MCLFCTAPAALREVHPQFGQRLPVAHPDQLAGAGLGARIVSAQSQLLDPPVHQRAHVRRRHQLTGPVGHRRIQVNFTDHAQQRKSSIGLPSTVP
jgi:hypothetical protein